MVREKWDQLRIRGGGFPGRKAVGAAVRGDGKAERRDITCRQNPEGVASNPDRYGSSFRFTCQL